MVMRFVSLVILVLLLLAGCQQQATNEKGTISPEDATPRADTETQLKINQEALLHGATDDIRLDAAMVMLFSDSPRARQVLIETLKQSENKPAKIAVCRALTVSRETRRQVNNKRDFIGPLAEVLKTEDISVAKYAAQAALLFDYDEISNVLEPMAKDAAAPVRARLNAIYALKVQMDIRAITLLVELVGDKNPQVSSTSQDALRSIGISVSKYARSRAQILAELRTKGMERFQRDLMIRQESRVNELEEERDVWQKLYLGSLDKIYTGIGDESQRGKFLVEQLGNSEPAVRLWALDKASQWRIGTQSKLPTELGPVLVKLISDNNRDVRLATAKLLSLTGELGSAEHLAEQFSVEPDEEVKLEMLVALGAACQYALVPTSGIQLPPELRKQAIDWAAEYLNDADPKKSYRGAEVMRKLLESGGLASDEVEKYLNLLAERYSREPQATGEALRGELLGTMARLCGQSVYKAESARRFTGLFEKALGDEADLVREAAVDGLISADKSKALKLLAKDFTNDHSQVIRGKVIELAGEVGGKDDLTWLWDKVGTNSESKPAWQAMLKIFNGCDINIISNWLTKFDSQPGKGKLADEQWIAFLELAGRKASADNRIATIRAIQEKLVRFYIKTGQFEQAAEYLGKLRESAETVEQKDVILGQLIEVYLRWPKVEAATRLVGNCLLEKDLGADSAVVRSIDAYWDSPNNGTDPNMVLEALKKIRPAEQRPMWEQQINRWTKRFTSVEPKVNSSAGSG